MVAVYDPDGLRSPAEVVAAMPEAERKAFFESLDEEEAKALEWMWRGWWARPKQLLPPFGDWNVWLPMGGRGVGKTRTGAEAIRELVTIHGYRRIGLIGRTSADVRDVMIEGESGIMNVFPPWFKPDYQPSRRRIVFPNGATATTYSADQPDQLRGPQHDALWADEVAAWRYEDAWHQAQFGLRLGPHPIALATTTPRPTKLMRQLVDDAAARPTAGKPVVLTVGSTLENRQNLAPAALKYLFDRYGGTRLGRQELEAQLLTDTPGALWQLGSIDDNRRDRDKLPDMKRIVVAVDPSAKFDAMDEDVGAETGIVVAGLGKDGHGYVLDDVTAKGTPAVWGRASISAYRKWMADRIVAEVNNGGDMVEHTIFSTLAKGEDRPAFKQVRASRGKATRAEPVSALYEKGWVHHVGQFAELEDQMCTWMPGDPSPDRMDALVWALTELMIHDTPDLTIFTERGRFTLQPLLETEDLEHESFD